MQRAGILLAPRTFSSGEIVYGAREPSRYALIDSYADALAHVRRLVAQGAHSIKNYNQPRRNQRQQVVAAARAENILVVPEGGSLFQMDITLIQDGNSTLEHNIPQQRFYEDVLSLWSQTQVGNNPTLVVSYGGLAGDPYWTPGDPGLEPSPADPPHAAGRARGAGARGRPRRPTNIVDQYSAAESHLLSQRGVPDLDRRPRPAAGHRRPLGIVEPRPRRRDADRGAAPRHGRSGARCTASPTSARSSPASSPTSSSSTPIPTQDIRNTDHIHQVMLNGRLYDAATLNETVTGNRIASPISGSRTAAPARRR